MYNLASLALGVIAIALPIIALAKKSADPRFSHVSHCACILALFCQISECHRLVLRGDGSALLDLSDTIVKLSYWLLITVMVLNLINYLLNQRNRK